MNTKSKLKAISIGIAAIMMVSLLAAVTTVSASEVTDCWIGDDNKVYFTIYSDAKAEGYICLNIVNGAYLERKKYGLNAGETTTLSFREYRWNGVDNVEVCADCVDSCCTPGPTPTPPPPEKPDLIVEKTVGFVDGGFIVHYKVTNIGYGEAGTSEICKSVDDVCTEVKTVPALGANGGFYCGDFDLETCQPGEAFTVTVCADCTHVVDESDETNNCVINYETCPEACMPDLIVEKTVGFVDGAFIVHYKVTNIGDGEAGTSEICKSVDDVCTEVETVPALGANGGFYCGDFDLETCQPGEAFTVKVCADCTHVVDESNENNNCVTNDETCPEACMPDLIVEKTVGFVDGGFIVHYKVTNIGDGEAGTSEICKSVDDVCTEVKTVPALGANGGFCCGDFDLETCVPGEAFTVKVCADCTHVVDESNENNNCVTNDETCPDVDMPDLVVEKTVEKRVVPGGDPTKECEYKVEWTVTNIGTATAGASKVALILDGVLWPWKIDINVLKPGLSAKGDFGWINCPCGDDLINVTVCADYTEVVTESNENNNCETNIVDNRIGAIEVIKQVWNVSSEKWEDEIFGAERGDLVYFRSTVHNSGCCCDLSYITVDDVLSCSLEYVTAVPEPVVECTAFGETILMWGEIGPLEPCEELVYEVVARVIGCGEDTNTLFATATTCTSEVVSDSDIATVNVPKQARIEVIKEVYDPDTGDWVDHITVLTDTDVHFRSIVHNDGTCCDLTNIEVWDVLSSSLEDIIDVDPRPTMTYNGPGGTTILYWSLPMVTLEPCEELVFYISTTAVGTPGDLDTNTLHAYGYSADTDEYPSGEDDATVGIVAAPGPDISITKTADLTEGEWCTNVTFTINVANTGDEPLNTVTVVDTLPVGMSYVALGTLPAPTTVVGNVLTWNLGILLDGDSTIINLVAHIDAGAGGPLVNDVEVGGISPVGVPVWDDAAETVTRLNASIAINKTATPNENVPVCTNVTFNITVTNDGDTVLNPVNVVDTLPAGMSYVSDDSGGLSDTPINGQVTWHLGAMAVGETKIIHLVAHVDVAGAKVNQVTAWGTSPKAHFVDDGDSATVT